MMIIPRGLCLVLRDVVTSAHLFLLEFIGTVLFLSTSLSAVLVLPITGRPGLNLRSAPNQSHLSAGVHQSGLAPVSFLCPLQVALVFGLSVAMSIVCVGGGAHLNPAVTLAMVLSLRLRLWKAALIIFSQLLGGMASAAVLLGLIGDLTPALNQVSSGVQLHQAVALETLVTFQLVLVVLATIDIPLPAVVSPLLVGLAVSLGHMVAVNVTGCGMNPARSFGPAAITHNFSNHWVFWAGPGLGACLATFMNDLLLRPRWHRPRDWLAELTQLYVLTEKQQQVSLSHPN
ncbi:aquaporin-1 isoform X1 [Mugil cephalus]|uniref:aquaporin-1 isoform X1 n=2 Tax=Mugil cephalus TaxID=48193 RepID=UPI001FB70E34|nr:aquaporin-1 isoform X1 [Mugil cephalus]XP_047428065.1 aquaporin-1 isoform X1 [Mugil cephalus]